MDIYVRRKPRNPFGVLLLTFALGLAVGFSLAYAYLGGRQPSTPAPVPAAQPAKEAAASEPPATPPPAPTPETPPAPAVEPVPVTPPAEMPQQQPPVAETPKPGRFLFVGVDASAVNDETKALLKEVQPGGVLLRGGHLETAPDATGLVQQIRDAVGAPDLIIAVEQEGGKRNPLGIEKAASAADLGRKKNVEAASEAGRACGKAAAQRGVTVVLAPVLNVLDRATKAVKDDDAYVSRDRVFGSDQALVEQMGLAFAAGISETGAVPVVKYYPGIGARRKEGPGAPYVLNANPRKLAELMYPFSEAAAKNTPAILVGHIAVPELDRANPERAASTSPVLVQTVLREKFNYKGLVLADDISGDSFGAAYPPERAILDALLAGCDGALFLNAQPDRLRAVCAALKDAAEKETVPKDRFAQSDERWKAFQELATAHAASAAKCSVAAPPETPTPTPPPPAEEPRPAAESAAPEKTPPPPPPPVAELVGAKPADAEPAAAAKPVEPAVVEAQPVAEPAPEPAKEKPAAAEEKKPETEPVAPEKEKPAAVEKKAETEPAAPQKEKPSAAEEKKPESESANADQPPNTEKIVHVIERGDSLSRIAAKYGVRASDIVKWNDMKNKDVKYGRKLDIYRPLGTEKKASAESAGATITHVVAKGESIQKIAKKYRVTRQSLVDLNTLDDPDHLEAGQELRVPAPAGGSDTERKGDS